MGITKIRIKLEHIVRWSGRAGIVVSAVAIITQDMRLFILSQFVATLSSYVWLYYLQGRLTWDLHASLALNFLALCSGSIWATYSAMLVRSISYQFVFERVVKSRIN